MVSGSSQPRPSISVADIRLQRLLFRGIGLASLGEYAGAAEMEVADVLAQLEPWLDGRSLELEAVAGELFLHTAPQGRPHPDGAAVAPANLWELLRHVGDPDYAASLWRIIRGLQRGGWQVRTHPVGATRPLTFLELMVDRVWTPMMVLPRRDRLGASDGPLARASQRSVSKVAVVCADGQLDEIAAQVRGWMTSYGQTFEVLLLEQPRYTPTLLSSVDIAVRPTSDQIKRGL
jgi:hypothetical protein